MKEIPETIKRLAEKYNVSVTRDIENCSKNNGASADQDIYLGEFDDPDIELVAFFHELGHCKSDEMVLKRGYTMSIMSGEGLAWELGLGLAYENGYKWSYYTKEMKWARERLKTYIENSDNF